MSRKLYTDGPPKPEQWELQKGWEENVCRAVIAYPMAPREAKHILDIAGELFSYGFKLSQIEDAMRELYNK